MKKAAHMVAYQITRENYNRNRRKLFETTLGSVLPPSPSVRAAASTFGRVTLGGHTPGAPCPGAVCAGTPAWQQTDGVVGVIEEKKPLMTLIDGMTLLVSLSEKIPC